MDKRSAVISALFEKKNKRKPKNSQELQDFVKSQGGDEFLKKVDEYIDQAEKELTKQAQKAEHGAKLQYLKSLKNKCNEDEELVYYKKGGTVDCGCKKKKGGEIKKSESGNPVERFKAKKAFFGTTLDDKNKKPKNQIPNRTKEEQAKIDRQSQDDYEKGTYGMSEEEIKKHNNNNDNFNKHVKKKKPVTPTHEKGGLTSLFKGPYVKKGKGGKACSVVDKFKAKCGTKMKIKNS